MLSTSWAKWLEPFHTHNTRRLAFHCLNGSRTTPVTMSMYRKKLHVACMEGFKVLKLPYQAGARQLAQGQHKRRRGLNGDAASSTAITDSPDADGEDTQYSMFIFLPDTLDGITTMVDVITSSPAFMYGVLAEMKEELIDLQLPKFEITFNWAKLEGTLRGMGLSLPFSRKAADLRDMFKENDVTELRTFVGKAAHTAVVKVDEKGTEAAAATMFMCGGGGPLQEPLKFIADHPFTFFIMEEQSGVIVFAGHVLDPTK
ncbi:hypothetical protein PR202_gb13106 [Eleusine coracana subsp. coracana]|uniref:Serpin domain-containing protein n=1 Tax=Eleusine coracana subsp. coracana TaxID=191504 RepID=A0AAV5ESB3_ELECO|nr:hypothetical protein PR202_gb13106 [Eleusine coracana subsp. coracana]